MSIAHAYTDWSTTYDTDRNRTRDLDAETTRRLLGHLFAGGAGLQPANPICCAASEPRDADPPSDGSPRETMVSLAGCKPAPRFAVELGCGTGKNTVLLATLADRVLALDFSEGMLAQARAKVTSENVTFAVADLTQPWPAGTNGADLIIGNLVLEHIEDLRPIFAQAAKALAPGGRLFLSELHPFRQYQGTQAHFQRDGQTTPIAAFQHHVSDYLQAAKAAGLVLEDLGEWWHAEDAGKLPRLLTLLCQKELNPAP